MINEIIFYFLFFITVIVIFQYDKTLVWRDIHGHNCGKLPIINNNEISPNFEKKPRSLTTR